MNIVITPDQVLLKPAQPVEKITPAIEKLIREMKQALVKSTIGVGLAAPQVGVSLRIFVAAPTLPDRKDKTSVAIKTFINPLPHELPQATLAGTDTAKLEGCLSIPDVWGHVTRNTSIKLTYLDEAGISHTRTFKGFLAIIIQHELDHLNGILFTHRVLEQGRTLYKPNEKGSKLIPVEL